MSNKSIRLPRFRRESLVRFSALYAIIIFLLVFLVGPLATLFCQSVSG